MLLSSSISRRYTPPTCTLEINAQTSALSRWTRRPVLKQLQFHLSFDNLLRSDDQPVQISGDRAQLDSLCEVIESYVQKLLNQLPTGWHTTLPESTAVISDFDSVASNDGAEATGALAPIPEPPETWDVYLQPKGLFHNLFLGSLATETSGSVINLSTSQLFDLASALEEYAAEPIALPNLKQRPLAWVQRTPIWARTAAIAVVVVGITTAALQLANNSNTISQKSEQPSTLPPPVPPPPPPGATPLPATELPTVTIPPSLPNIAPPPPGLTSGAAPESNQNQSEESPTVAIKPPAAANKKIVIKPRSQPSKPQTTASTTPKPSRTSRSSQANATSSAASQAQPSGRLFDTSPQVKEVREYFKQTWQPPKDLKQSLQYTLVLNSNGSIIRALPLGQAAKKYLLNGETPIPSMDKSVFSPIKGGGTLKIRLVLDPDGRVETLPESSN